MSTTLSEVKASYQLHHIDTRTGQVLALLQNAAIGDDQFDVFQTSGDAARCFGAVGRTRAIQKART
jgi:hypothetical protein